MFKKNIFLFFALLFLATQNLIGNNQNEIEIDDKKLKNIAEGILANLHLDLQKISILAVEPLPQNNTILQIGFKNLVNNDIEIVYAVSADSIIAGGNLFNKDFINKTFETQIKLYSNISSINANILNELKNYAILLGDKKDDSLKDLFIIISPFSSEFDFLFNSNHYLKLNKEYNINLIFISQNDKDLLFTSQFIDLNKKNISIKTLQNIYKNKKINKKISDKEIIFLNNAKNILYKTKETLSANELNGNTPIYFIDNRRVNPNTLINSLHKNDSNATEKVDVNKLLLKENGNKKWQKKLKLLFFY